LTIEEAQNHITWSIDEILIQDNGQVVQYEWLPTENIIIDGNTATTSLTIQPNDFIGTVAVRLTATDEFGATVPDEERPWIYFQTLVWPYIDPIQNQEIAAGETITIPISFGHETDGYVPDLFDVQILYDSGDISNTGVIEINEGESHTDFSCDI
jgi:hypothetical protein